MQPSSVKPALDRGGAEPHRQQLSPGHHTVLAFSQNCQIAIRWQSIDDPASVSSPAWQPR
jgi:hypothetical protein